LRASTESETSEEQGTVIRNFEWETGVHAAIVVIEVIKAIARQRSVWEAFYSSDRGSP
jgi:hypothetical protein